MEEMINSFTSLPLMVKPDDGYELIQPGTNNYAVRGAIRLKDTIQKITTLDELKKQIERVGNIFDLMIVKK